MVLSLDVLAQLVVHRRLQVLRLVGVNLPLGVEDIHTLVVGAPLRIRLDQLIRSHRALFRGPADEPVARIGKAALRHREFVIELHGLGIHRSRAAVGVVGHGDFFHRHLLDEYRREGHVAGNTEGFTGLDLGIIRGFPVAELLAFRSGQPGGRKGQGLCLRTKGILSGISIGSTFRPLIGHRVGVASPAGVKGHIAGQGAAEGIGRITRPALDIPAQEIGHVMTGITCRCIDNILKVGCQQHMAEVECARRNRLAGRCGVVDVHFHHRRDPLAVHSQVAIAHGHVDRYRRLALRIQIPALKGVARLRRRSGLLGCQGIADGRLVGYRCAARRVAIHIEVDGVAVAGVVELGAVIVRALMARPIAFPVRGILVLGEPGNVVEVLFRDGETTIPGGVLVVPHKGFAIKCDRARCTRQSLYIVVGRALVAASVSRGTTVMPIEVIAAQRHDGQEGLGSITILPNMPVAAGPLIPNVGAILGGDSLPDIPAAVRLHAAVARSGMFVLLFVAVRPPQAQKAVLMRFFAAGRLRRTLYPELHRVGFPVEIHIDDGGAVAGHSLAFAVIAGVGKARSVGTIQLAGIHLAVRQGDRLTGGTGHRFRGSVGILLVVSVLRPVLDGVCGIGRCPVGVEGFIGRRAIRAEIHCFAAGGLRVPAVEPETRPGGVAGRSHCTVGLRRHRGHRGRAALAVKGHHDAVSQHRVDAGIAGHRGIGGEIRRTTVPRRAPSHQDLAGLQNGLYHVNGIAHSGAVGIHGDGGHHGSAGGVVEGDIVDAIKLGIDVVDHIFLFIRGHYGSIACLQHGAIFKVPALEDAVPGGGSRQLHRLAILQDLGGAIDQLTRSSRPIIELIGRHIGGAHRVDGEVLRHEGDHVGADLLGEQTLDEVHDLLQETKVLVNIVQRLVRIHMEYAQLLVALEGRRLDAHLHRALRLPGRAINRDVDVVGPQGLHPLQLHRDRNRSDYRVFGDVAGDGNDRAVTGCAADGYRSQCLDRQEAEHHHQRQYQG